MSLADSQIQVKIACNTKGFIVFSNVFYIYVSVVASIINVTHNRSCYSLITNEQKYNDHKQVCADMGMRLVVITSQDENNFVMNTIK